MKITSKIPTSQEQIYKIKRKNKKIKFNISQPTFDLIESLENVLEGVNVKIEIEEDVGRPRIMRIWYYDSESDFKDIGSESYINTNTGNEINENEIDTNIKNIENTNIDNNKDNTNIQNILENNKNIYNTKITFKIINHKIINTPKTKATQIITKENNYIPFLKALVSNKNFKNNLILSLTKETKYNFLYLIFYRWNVKSRINVERVGPMLTLKEIGWERV